MPDPAGERAFWLCHSCGAQMRPIRVDGTPHCASCNSEFIEILDEEINPDPWHDLPPAPPVRPGSSPPVPGNRPHSPHAHEGGPGGSLPGMMGSLFSSLFGGPDNDNDNNNDHPHAGQRDTQASPGPGPSGRTYTFNIGGGTGSVTFGSFGGGGGGGGGGGMAMGPFGPYHPAGPSGGDQGGGLDAFFPGFPPPAGPRRPGGASPGPGGGGGGGAGARPGDPNDIMRALMGLLMDEGVMQGPQGRMDMGDYVASQHGFDEVMERLMQAAGPQGPLPATQAVIDGLPRFKLDGQKIEKSPFKDCPVCKDDFVPDDEVMRIPCEHIFHVDCLQPWLQTNGSCPVCRFSLVPDGANRPPPPRGQPGQPGPGSPAPGQQPPVGAGAAASPFTNILNRLWGQSGAAPHNTSTHGAESSGNAAPAPHPQQVYSSPTSPPPQRQRVYDPPSSPPPSQRQRVYEPPSSPPPRPATGTSTAASGDADTLPNSIPEDYRARHRQREREQQQQEQHGRNPYGDDLD